jgi:hypothetical protein
MFPAREIVIERHGDGFAFRLPDSHRARLSAKRTEVTLSMPNRGATFKVVEVVEDAVEVRIVVGAVIAKWASGVSAIAGYPFPTATEELEYLMADYVSAGGEPARAEARAREASWDERMRWLRDEIRRRRGRQ